MYNGGHDSGFQPPPSRGWVQQDGPPPGSFGGPDGFAPYQRRPATGLGFGPPGGPGGPDPRRVQHFVIEGGEDEDAGALLSAQYGPVPHQFPESAQSGNERLQLFIGNIAQNLHDFWIQRLLSCAGPVLHLNRVKGADGKPKAFGFAQFADFDTVLRCLEVINGCPLKGEDGVEKRLSVKADEKTRPRLEQYQRSRMRTDQDEEHLNFTRNNLTHVLREVRDGNAQLFSAGAGPIRRRRLVAHLQDLGEDDLPPEQRGMITSEIASFRDRAFKTEKPLVVPPPAPMDRGRPSPNMSGPPPGGPPRHSGGYNPSGQGPDRPGFGPPNGHSPTGFVRERPRSDSHMAPSQQMQQAAATPAQAPVVEEHEEGVDDEAAFERREEQKRRDAEASFRDREKRWEAHERQRDDALRREADRERRETATEERERDDARDRFARYDDDVEAERGREAFYTDRPRWRTARRAVRQRELDADRADAELEARQAEEADKKSEAFLNSIAVPSATNGKPARKSRFDVVGDKTGAKLDEATPIKLSLVPAAAATSAAINKSDSNGPTAAVVGGVSVALPKLSRPATAFAGADEDDEDVFGKKKKRTLIPLTYDNIDPEAGLSEAQKLERRKEKVRELVESIPEDKERLWAYHIPWDFMTDEIITSKLIPFTERKTVEALGFKEEEIVNAVVEHVRHRKMPSELAEELSPVLDDDTDAFVIKVYRFVAFECAASQQGIETHT